MFESPAWKLYKTLKTLCEFAVAKVCTDDSISKLDNAISAYLNARIEFRNYYSANAKLNKPLSCKACWLLHYPSQVLNLGPLSLFETNIAESKNGQMRKLSTKANQTKNVLKTTAEREMLQSTVRAQLDKLETSSINSAKSHDKWDDLLPVELSILHKGNVDRRTHYLYRLFSWMGSTFRSKDNMIICYGSVGQPKFGYIDAIASLKSGSQDPIFLVTPVATKQLEHLGCLSIKKLGAKHKLTVTASDLLSARPLLAYECTMPDGNQDILFTLYEALPT